MAANPGSSSHASGPPASAQGAGPRVAYLMSRFPKLTETFVLREMMAVEAVGAVVELYPLQYERATKVHPEALPWVERGHFTGFLSGPIVAANLAALATRPLRYLSTLAALVRHNFGSPRYLAGALGFFPKAVYFARRMAAGRVEHVHAHFASHPAAVAWVIHRMSGLPYSFTAHGSDLHRDRHMLGPKVRDSAFTVAISEYNRRVILDECGPAVADRVAVIHCGVDLGMFDARRDGIPPSAPSARPLLVCVGTLHEVKGQAYLIAACAALARKGLDFECQLIGGGPDQAALERQAAEAGIADRVIFRGQLTQDEVRDTLRRADLVVAPSVPTADGRREGIPVALMEAMASGVAVVSSRLSGIPELVEDGVSGLLAEPRDVEGLTAAIERLLADPALRARMAAAGRARVEREFDLYANAVTLLGRFRDTRGPGPAPSR